MNFKLVRHPDSPILVPNHNSSWECYNVFNPSVIYHEGLFHMHYRAQGADWISRIGYAVSEDGIHWNRLRGPVLEPHDGSDSRGVEDPRLQRAFDVGADEARDHGRTAHAHEPRVGCAQGEGLGEVGDDAAARILGSRSGQHGAQGVEDNGLRTLYHFRGCRGVVEVR